ncbi:MAG: sigma 54-interacting transcriptional regulator [bacterium]
MQNQDLKYLEQLMSSGKISTAKLHYAAVADRLKLEGEEEEHLVLDLLKAQILAAEDRYQEAVEIANRLIPRLKSVGLNDKVAHCHLLLSKIWLRLGDYELARSHAEACVYFATWELDDRSFAGDAHTNLGLALKNLGFWAEAERHLRKALEACSTSDDVRRVRASLNLAILLRKMGKIADAREIAEDAFNRSQMLSIPVGIVRCALELANIAVIERDANGARRWVEIARKAMRDDRYERESVLLMEAEGDAEVVLKRYEKAIGIYSDALRKAEAIACDGDLVVELLRRLAQAYLALRRLASARNCAERAVSLNQESGDRYELGICFRILGEIDVAEGMVGRGIERLEKAATILSSLSEWLPDLARTEEALGQTILLKLEGQEQMALEHLLTSRKIYSSLGIGSAIRHLDDLIVKTVSTTSFERRCATHPKAATKPYRRVDLLALGMVTFDERIIGDLERWGKTEARIIIEGETGVGKEVMARALHALSPRREAKFVAVDCAALNETLADSELFGHAKGAFTGAIRDRVGLFEEADGGTIFLDEIGELSEALQVKLLRVLEEGVIRRVGENHPRAIDVRVISATARNLWEEVEAGRFRRDLYYRLKTSVARIPSLRERPHDIPPIFEYYLSYYSKQYQKDLEVDGSAMAEIMRYDWPGNVRELRGFAEALVVSATSAVITSTDILAILKQADSVQPLKESMSDAEKKVLLRAISMCGGNRTRAARMLGISRKTLWQKLKAA